MDTEPEPLSDKKGSLSDHLSNERTFLAWTRTGLGIFTLGCAVARFGGTTNSPIGLTSASSNKKSTIAGLMLAVYGIVCLLYSIWRYYRINRQIDQKGLHDKTSEIREPVVVAMILCLLMVTVVILLLIL